MAKNGWFRFYSETISDRKLQRIARDTGESLTSVIGIWASILSMANDSPKRGTLMMTEAVHMCTDDIASILGVEPKHMGAIMDMFVNMGMINLDGKAFHVTNWDKRQYVDTTNDRVRRFREKRAETSHDTPISEHGNVTETLQKRYRNVTVTNRVTHQTTDNRQQTTDKSKPLSPDGDGGDSERKRELRPDEVALSAVEVYFSEESGIPLPARKTDKDKKGAAVRWWGPLRSILAASGADPEQPDTYPMATDNAKRSIEMAVRHMRENKLTLSAPKSIEQIVIAAAADKQNRKTIRLPS